MTGIVAPAASACWFLALSILVGLPALLATSPARFDPGVAPSLKRGLSIAAAAALLAGFATLAVRSIELGDMGGLWVLLSRTRLGKVWTVEESAVAVAAIAVWATPARALQRPAVLLVVAALAAIPLAVSPVSSHSAGADWAAATIAVHAIHQVAIALWLGGVLGLATGVVAVGREGGAPGRFADLLASFSRRAPFLMAAAVASGVLLAVEHVGGWPALLATPYGAILVAKLVLLAGALAAAAWLRSRVVQAPAPRSPRRALLFEAGFGVAVLAVAGVLAETVPGAHDTVSWWLPFRFSIEATWDLAWVPERVVAGGGLLFVAVSAAAGTWLRGRRLRAGVLVALGAVAGGAVALPAIAVEAYPGTYWDSEVPFHAVSVAHGRELFREHCVRCHGESGRGDGPLADETDRPPADLTEPHTADHTAGDMYWWLTHGIPDAGMPPFDDALSPADRWDLINYLRAFAAGHQAKLLGPRIAPERPWLGSIDFNYVTADGERGILRDLRGEKVVLLVLFTPGASEERMESLRGWLTEIRAREGAVLAIPLAPIDGERIDALAPLPVVVEQTEEIATSYLLFRRTFESPGNDRDDDRPDHLELLVDRFGYVRARWRPDGDRQGFADRDLLLGEIARLAREPEILPPPDEHVH